jgi:hypothetical protein
MSQARFPPMGPCRNRRAGLAPAEVAAARFRGEFGSVLDS